MSISVRCNKVKDLDMLYQNKKIEELDRGFIFIQHDKKHVVPTSLSAVRVRKQNEEHCRRDRW
jgi:hypothetical protein